MRNVNAKTTGEIECNEEKSTVRLHHSMFNELLQLIGLLIK